MIHKGLFILAHQAVSASFYSTYRRVTRNQWRPYHELKEEQEIGLRHMVKYAYANVPYYHGLFRRLDLMPADIHTIDDLEKLPILTKDIVRRNWDDLKPATLPSMKYDTRATGGTTGTPMQYRVLKNDRFLGAALLYRGWGLGGYELGDRMVFLAGSSLDVTKRKTINNALHERTRNIRKLSSFDMEEAEMQDYARTINSFKPLYIRGYASSIYFLAQWLQGTGTPIPPIKGVFTTAEKLFPHMRETIGRAFGCDVYDTYGLNDGGISAFECQEHNGLHIDTERGIMEVVDMDGLQVNQGEGNIIATSLYNYAMPFIRYDTGDRGFLLDDYCSCGRGHLLLKEVFGRQQEMLITPEGKHIHGEFFTHIFWEIPYVKEFQVVQKKVNHLIIYIVPDENFYEKNLEYVRSVISSRSKGWELEFQLVDMIDRSKSGKYKFIINEVLNG